MHLMIRRVKVEEHDAVRRSRYCPRTKSRIRLKGAWLHEAGFLPGQYVRVIIQEGKLILEAEEATHIQAA